MKQNNPYHQPRRERERLFGTREVALIVGCPEWRVKNFAQPAYGLPPSQILGGGGRGSRRLYNYRDVKRVCIADALVRCGFAPEAVGAGVREVPQSMLDGRYDILLSKELNPEGANLPVLIAQGGEWSIVRPAEVDSLLKTVWAGSAHDALAETDENLFVLNVLSLLHRMFWRHVKLEADGKLSRWLLEDDEIRRMYEAETEG